MADMENLTPKEIKDLIEEEIEKVAQNSELLVDPMSAPASMLSEKSEVHDKVQNETNTKDNKNPRALEENIPSSFLYYVRESMNYLSLEDLVTAFMEILAITGTTETEEHVLRNATSAIQTGRLQAHDNKESYNVRPLDYVLWLESSRFHFRNKEWVTSLRDIFKRVELKVKQKEGKPSAVRRGRKRKYPENRAEKIYNLRALGVGFAELAEQFRGSSDPEDLKWVKRARKSHAKRLSDATV